MHPRPFLRTSSKCRLIPSCDYESPPPPPPVADVKGAPQHVVIGFHLGSDNCKQQTDRCESPRSVLEHNALRVSAHPEQARSPRSPRSVLGSLLSGQGAHCPRIEGVGLGVVAAIKAEEARSSIFSSNASVMSKPIAISEQNQGVCERRHSVLEGGFVAHLSACYGGVGTGDEYDDLEVDEDYATGLHESIFCAASPFSTSCSLEFPTCDFLSVCFFCKCSLTHGKDVYMYKLSDETPLVWIAEVTKLFALRNVDINRLFWMNSKRGNLLQLVASWELRPEAPKCRRKELLLL